MAFKKEALLNPHFEHLLNNIIYNKGQNKKLLEVKELLLSKMTKAE